jgi:hypothetical protein
MSWGTGNCAPECAPVGGAGPVKRGKDVVAQPVVGWVFVGMAPRTYGVSALPNPAL